MRLLFLQDSEKLAMLAASAAAMLLTTPGQVDAAIIEAKSVSLPDVRSAIASAKDGDTVRVPAGTCSWASTLTITKSITLQGQTVVTGAGTASPTVTDGTVILDDVPMTRAIGGGACPLIKIAAAQNQVLRISGFTFRHGSRTTHAGSGAAIWVPPGSTIHGLSGTGSLRIDHCLFDLMYQQSVRFSSWITNAVVDHVVGNYWHQVHHSTIDNGTNWNGGDGYGDSSWSDNSYLGSEKFVFFEDNTVNNTTPSQTTGTIDSQHGGRYVVRHCYFLNCAPNTHGTETGGRIRGIRVHEWYQNTIKFTYAGTLGMMRSGTGVSWGNTLLGPLPKGNFLSAARQTWPMFIPFGDTPPNSAANGGNRWDLNVTEPDGVSSVPGHASYTFASGAATSASTDGPRTGTVTVSHNSGWQMNQWVGYSVTNTTRGRIAGSNYGSYITASTGDTITYSRRTTATPPASELMHFVAGDGFVIHKLVASLDQPGYGKCNDLIAYDNRGQPYNTTYGAGVRAWPHQHREPLYSWQNTLNGSPMRGPTEYYSSPYPTIQPNREFYNEINPFDGTSGVGVGLRAERSSTCTPGSDPAGGSGFGVAYWATDEQKLYVCIAPNSWSVYYKPYIYPHPLVSGSGLPHSDEGGPKPKRH
jgi:hypothetical protein